MWGEGLGFGSAGWQQSIQERNLGHFSDSAAWMGCPIVFVTPIDSAGKTLWRNCLVGVGPFLRISNNVTLIQRKRGKA